MQEFVARQIQDSIRAKEAVLAGRVDVIAHTGMILASIFQRGGKLLICGNGGSAADAQHIATELSIRYKAANVRPSLPAISLAADSSAITAGGNDFGFDQIFARQIEGLGREGDGLLAITTSGNSGNIIEAVRAAKLRGMFTFLLTGPSGGRIFAEERDKLDHVIRVPAEETSRIQECHIMIGQILCAVVEKELYGLE